MNRLILLMIGSCSGDTCQDIKGELAVRLLVLDLRDLIGRKGSSVVRSLMLKGPRNATLEDIGLETRVHEAAIETERGVERWSHVAYLLKFLPDARIP